MMKMKKLLAFVLCLLLAAAAFPTAFAEGAEEAEKAEEANLQMTGTIIEIEKFGHAVLDIRIEDFENAG